MKRAIRYFTDSVKAISEESKTADGKITRPQTFIVVEVKPEVPCRVEPVQRIRCVRCCDGFETRFSEAKGWAAVGVPV